MIDIKEKFWNKEGEFEDIAWYNLIWVLVDHITGDILQVENPKGLMCMTPEKALGSIKWSKSILGKDYPCFVYCPDEISIFNEDGSYDEVAIHQLVKQFDGTLKGKYQIMMEELENE